MKQKLVWDQPLSTETEQNVLKLSNIDLNSDLSNFRVLDFGCGNGRYLELFASYGIPKQNLYGTEISVERVTQVKQTGFRPFQLNPRQNSLPFRSGSFHIVFSSNVIEHIPRNLYLGYLKEIHRVLKDGGRFIVGTPNYPAKRFYDLYKAVRTKHHLYYLLDDPTHCNKLSFFQLERDLSSWFEIVKLEPTSFHFLEKLIPPLKRPEVRYRFRRFGDKIVGYCIK